MRILAISDIHGCLNTFKALLQKIELSKKDQLFLVGDFIDRGPDSKGVIDHIWNLQMVGYSIFCIRGNHEQMLLDIIDHSQNQDNWLYYGGKETLQSFQVNEVVKTPNIYVSWMKQLPFFYEHENYIFVHAGLNFDVPNPLEAFHSMLWIRGWYEDVNYGWLKNRIIIHGHTSFSKTGIEEMLDKLDRLQVIDIDCGCFFDSKDKGYLCGLDLTNRRLYFQKKVGDG